MIIYSAAFLLSADAVAATALSLPRICYQTFTRDAAVIVTASTETDGGPKDAPLAPSTHDYWQASELPATWEIDFGATQSVDYVGIAEHTIGSSGASVTIETSDGTTSGSPPALVYTALATPVSPADDAPLLFLDTARNARHMRISIAGAGTIPKIAVAYAGIALAMPRGPEMGFAPPSLSRTTELNNTMSRGGQFLGQGIKKMGVSASISFARIDHTFYRASVDPFVKVARQFPYFIAWHPGDYPLEVAYVWTAEDIHPQYSEWDQVSVAWNMVGIGNE